MIFSYFPVDIAAQLTGSTATPVAGGMYTLFCEAIGTTSSVTYQWRKDGSVIQGETIEMLSFSPLGLSDAGQYTCEITVGSVIYTDDVNVTVQSE